jgi:hypothetical protein
MAASAVAPGSPARVHVLTVAFPARKSFTRRREFRRAFRGRMTVPNSAKAVEGGRQNGLRVLIYH